MRYRAARAVPGFLLSLAVASAQSTSTTNCDTSVTVTNVYGQNGQFYLWVANSANPSTNLITQNFTVGVSNGTTTISLRVDQNGLPVTLVPGVLYNLSLETYGPGVCCGAFSNYTLALSGDLEFTNGMRSYSGFLAPGSLTPQTVQFQLDTSGTSCPVLIDPVPALTDPAQSNFITQTPAALSSMGTPVVGIAADGASRVVLRIPANTASDQIYVQVVNDLMNPSTSIDDDGGLDVISGQNFVSFVSSPLTVTQPNPASSTYMAFAVYRAPIDFVRAGQGVPCTTASPSCDSATSTRTVYIQVQDGSSTYTFPIAIVRPPVVLVHGLTADRTAWDNFTPFILNPLFRIYLSNYGDPVSNVTDISPNYTASLTGGTVPVLSLPNVRVTGSELGFLYNAPTVLHDIQDAINSYKTQGPVAYPIPVASVQADIVAHSMGGVITRTAARSQYDFFIWDNYYAGSVHKMITLGTPHLGSPNSLQTLDTSNSENYCLATLLAEANILELQGAVVSGNYASGGTYDLGGDGMGGSLSPALQALQIPAYKPMRIATLAGIASTQQYVNLALLPTGAVALAARAICLNPSLPYNPNSIPQNYTPTGWPILMANGNLAGAPSDGVVPLTSALDNSPSYTASTAGLPDSVTALNTFTGVIHSPGVKNEGFGPPYLQQAGAGTPVLVQDRVLQLLNTSVSANVFQLFP